METEMEIYDTSLDVKDLDARLILNLSQQVLRCS